MGDWSPGVRTGKPLAGECARRGIFAALPGQGPSPAPGVRGSLVGPTLRGSFSFLRMCTPSERAAETSAQAKKQALQDHVLAMVHGHRLAGAAVAMGVGKTLIGLRDMARLLPDSQ